MTLYLVDVTNVVDGGGYSVRNWFNNQGLLYAVSNAFAQVRATVFDIEDRPTSTTDANGVEVDRMFDTLGRVHTRTYPDGGVEHFGYSINGLSAYTNQIGNVARYGYDRAGRKTAETNANEPTCSVTMVIASSKKVSPMTMYSPYEWSRSSTPSTIWRGRQGR